MPEVTPKYLYLEIPFNSFKSYQVSILKKIGDLWQTLRSYADRIDVKLHVVVADDMLHYIFDLSTTAYSDEFRNQIEELRRKAYDLGVAFSPVKLMSSEQAQKELVNV